MHNKSTPLNISRSSNSSLLKTSFSKLHDSINSYFPIKFTKIQDILIDTKQLSQYMAKLDCLLCTDIRYLVAITPRDILAVGTQVPLKKLNWISFQTRTSNDHDMEFASLKLPPQSISESVTKDFMNTKVFLVNKTQDRSIYHLDSSEFSFCSIELLYTFKKKELDGYDNHSNTIQEYASKGTILSAVNTFNCIINMF